jgi:plasmid stabilization system protein ParE
MKLRYTPAAICDLQEIESYIRDTRMNPDAAIHTISAIAESCASLKDQPQMGGKLRKKLGREIEGRYIVCGKHIVIYDIDEAISILRVLDTRTDYIKAILSELLS